MKHITSLAVVAILAMSGIVQAEEWGTFSGQFIFDGELPATEKINTNGKDPAVCVPDKLFKDDLVINKKTKGVGNIFVYMRKTKVIHPDLEASEKKEVVFDQKGCQFMPHAMVVRTDQTVLVKSADGTSHNTHTYTLKNKPVNFIIPGVNRKGIAVKKPLAESLPMSVKCDVHPWMKAYWLILDHPYAAVSSVKDGKFKIEKLPAGEHEFRFWQERVGYVKFEGAPKGRLKVMIKKDGEPMKPIKLTLDMLTDEDE